jgi:hypothetical protein
VTKAAASLFIERRFIPHDGTRRTIATGIVGSQDAQVMLAGSRAAAAAIRAGLVASRKARAAQGPEGES